MPYEFDEEDDDPMAGDGASYGASYGEPIRPATAEDHARAIQCMARMRHLADQSGEAAQTLGMLVGRFVRGLKDESADDLLVQDLANHYLERLMPVEPDRG